MNKTKSFFTDPDIFWAVSFNWLAFDVCKLSGLIVFFLQEDWVKR